jgi:hypothetical protein
MNNTSNLENFKSKLLNASNNIKDIQDKSAEEQIIEILCLNCIQNGQIRLKIQKDKPFRYSVQAPLSHLFAATLHAPNFVQTEVVKGKGWN